MQLQIFFSFLLILIQSDQLWAKPTKGFTKSGNVNPVILVPGIAGSQLSAKLDKPSVPHYYCQKKTDDFFNIWLNLELIVPIAINCWVDNVMLQYDKETRTTKNANGVEIVVTDFGNTSTIEYINPSRLRYTVYFDPIVKSLQDHGYENGLNLFGTPYDFRKSPGELVDFYENLDKLILTSYKNNGNLPVIIVCHSMGCLMIYMHLDKKTQEWRDTYIKSLITLGAPWGGSVKSVKEIVSGDNLGVSFMDQGSVRDISRTFPSVPFLFPKPGFWREDEPLMTVELSPNRNMTYTSSNYEDLLTDMQLNNTLEIYRDVSKLMTHLKPPNVEVHCYHGYGLDTPRKLHFKKGTFPDGSPLVINGDGDGTVNTRSLEYCQYWKGRQKQDVTYMKFNNVEHMQTVSNKDVVTQVIQTITGLKFNNTAEMFNGKNYYETANLFTLNMSLAQAKAAQQESKMHINIKN